ncbi:MAG: acyl carrier protein [Oscillospiraceae bacterium]|nr:acyl carrier protein [Oscillospiraceae bacterium]
MFELVQKIVYEVTGRTGLTLDTDFVSDLELNSFDIMSIVCAFEDRFDTSIPTRDVWKLRRVSDVLEYMKQRGVTEA